MVDLRGGRTNSKLRMLFTLPPRLAWSGVFPIASAISGLTYPYLIGMLRAKMPDEIEPVYLNCNFIKMGWRSLEKYIRENRFDAVGLSSETIYVNSDKQILKWVRKYHPNAKIIVGGVHYPYRPQDVFDEHLADFIVRGEGEFTLVELLKQMISAHPNYDEVAGMLWMDDAGKIHDAGYRDPVDDLDKIPTPAYDLLLNKKEPPLIRNGDLIHSRGCDMSCAFCTIWRQMGKWVKDESGNAYPTSWYRTHSPERTLEEVDYLVKKGRRNFLSWQDGTFEANVEWTDNFMGLLLSKGYKVHHFSFSRADTLLKCQELGTLKKMQKAGWSYLVVGGERADETEASSLNRPQNNVHNVVELAKLLREKYPKIGLHVTFLAGLPDDNLDKLKGLARHIKKNVKPDVSSLLFFTPMPATKELFDRYEEENLLTDDFSGYSWYMPAVRTRCLSIEELAKFWGWQQFATNLGRPWRKVYLIFRSGFPVPYVLGFAFALRYVIRKLFSLFKPPSKRKTTFFRDLAEPRWHYR